MESLIIEPKSNTPYIKFDYSTGIMDLKGRSTPENSVEYYDPILSWLDQYRNVPKPKTIVNVQFEYFNTSSSKCILDVLKKFVLIHKAGNDVIVNWFYEEEDEDMQEAGEDYSDILDVPFNILPVE